MHVLRSTYLPAYTSLIRPPYSSDPFPAAAPDASTATHSRETKVLDLFISLKVREDLYMDDSELHLEREGSFKDLFVLMQPKGRIEDLVRVYGLRKGVIHLSDQQPLRPSKSPQPISFATLSVSFFPKNVRLVMSGKVTKRTIVEIARTQESLEFAAQRLVEELQIVLSQGG